MMRRISARFLEMWMLISEVGPMGGSPTMKSFCLVHACVRSVSTSSDIRVTFYSWMFPFSLLAAGGVPVSLAEDVRVSLRSPSESKVSPPSES